MNRRFSRILFVAACILAHQVQMQAAGLTQIQLGQLGRFAQMGKRFDDTIAQFQKGPRATVLGLIARTGGYVGMYVMLRWALNRSRRMNNTVTGVNTIVQQGDNKILRDRLLSELPKTKEQKEELRNDIENVIENAIVGVKDAKDELASSLYDIFKLNEIEMQTGLVKRSPALLFQGHPGTGKTELASVVAKNLGFSFIKKPASELYGAFTGHSSARIRDLFDRARENEPCIVVVDEIDTIGGQRQVGGTGADEERAIIVNTLLTELDKDSRGLILILTTNRAGSLDEAFVRPGRIGSIVQFDLPNVNERKEILKRALKEDFPGAVGIDGIAEATQGWSGADLVSGFVAEVFKTIKRACNREKNPGVECKKKHFDTYFTVEKAVEWKNKRDEQLKKKENTKQAQLQQLSNFFQKFN